jgi:hypothetical protein
VTDCNGGRFLIQLVGRRASCTPAPGATAAADGIVCLGPRDGADWPAVMALGSPVPERA